MFCKLCNVEVSKKFYRHLNSSHKMKKKDYLTLFPEQIDEYKNQVPALWNKGKTKHSDERVARYAQKIAQHTSQDHIREERSRRMKRLYENGDILSPEKRAEVVKKGSQAWVKRVKSASFEERRLLLKNFTDAGNKKIQEIKDSRTPEDYMRIFPTAKGKAQYGNCAECGKHMIIWVGGRPRPKQRFCNKLCQTEYQIKHPFYTMSHIGQSFFSSKMKCEFFLRSNLELWFAENLEAHDLVTEYGVAPVAIPYVYNGKQRLYYPDFMVNSRHLIELKSGYVFSLHADQNQVKFLAAGRYADENGMEFLYWQFDRTNMTKGKFEEDDRIRDFFAKELQRA